MFLGFFLHLASTEDKRLAIKQPSGETLLSKVSSEICLCAVFIYKRLCSKYVVCREGGRIYVMAKK